MPLVPPALDDRSFDDLLADLLSSIPAHTPEWDAPQPGDPGRTLLELFAWLADAVLYRANLIPEKQRLSFLKLLGMPLTPANPARGLVGLIGDPANVQTVSLAPGAVVGGRVAFETLGGLDLLPIVGQVFKKAPLSPTERANALPLLTGLQALYKLGATPTGYFTQALFANDQADPNGVDLLHQTLDQSLWIALLAPKAALKDAVTDDLGGKDGRQRILNVGFVPALRLPDPFADVSARAAITASFQLSLKPGPGGVARFDELKVFDDTTQGFTRPGVIRLGLPQASDIGAPSNDVKSDAQAGVGTKPPRIDDLDTQDRLICWVRLKTTAALSVSWLGVNAVEIDQRTTRQGIVAGVSDGSANQQLSLGLTQIDPTSLELEVDMPSIGYQLWDRVEDLGVINGARPVYTLDAEAGTVTFGDNLRGMVPPQGRRIRLRRARAGGGTAGNLPPGSLTKINAKDVAGAPITQKITVKQPLATGGGDDVETLEHAERRIPAFIQHCERAVTAADYQNLVEAIPGARVGRVEVLPLFKPQTRKSNVPGVVSVMVLPEKDGFQPPCPRADRPLLETVYGDLNPRKPVSAELYVIGTEYLKLGIAVAVEMLAGFDLRVVAQNVEDALRRYLWPLAPGGPAQTGWPLGRHVRSLELEVIVSQVQGVVEVNGIQLFRYQPNGSIVAVPHTANLQEDVTLAFYQLPELLQVKVSAGPDGSGVRPATRLDPEPDPGSAVAVPVARKVC